MALGKRVRPIGPLAVDLVQTDALGQGQFLAYALGALDDLNGLLRRTLHDRDCD